METFSSLSLHVNIDRSSEIVHPIYPIPSSSASEYSGQKSSINSINRVAFSETVLTGFRPSDLRTCCIACTQTRGNYTLRPECLPCIAIQPLQYSTLMNSLRPIHGRSNLIHRNNQPRFSRLIILASWGYPVDSTNKSLYEQSDPQTLAKSLTPRLDTCLTTYPKSPLIHINTLQTPIPAPPIGISNQQLDTDQKSTSAHRFI